MISVHRASGLNVQLPDTFQLFDVVPANQALGILRGRTLELGQAESNLDPVVQSAMQQEMQLIDAIEIRSGGQAVAARSAPGIAAIAPAAQPQPGHPAQLILDVEPHEGAVVLLEQNGVYSWHVPIPQNVTITPAARRGVELLPPAKRVMFELQLTGPEPEAEVAKRGLIGDFIRDQVRAYVLKFAAGVITGQAMKFLEANVRRGIVVMDSEDPSSWRCVDDLSSLTLPTDRPARILLFFHGTFSSTAGSFGALTATPWGCEFMRAARTNYDLLIGFDHPTLSEDPVANASDLITRLQRTSWKFVPRLDAVAFSRGGLVFRCLVEYLLPASGWQARFGRGIFVACTNSGSQLASPENWHRFIDLYTNLAVAGCRAVRLIAPAATAAFLIKEAVQGIAALAKYLVAATVEEQMIPGLAAMEPNGAFVRQLNRAQPGQPTIASSYYCIVTSQFDVSLLQQSAPQELPALFVKWLLNNVANQIMSEDNDLVVNDSSMGAIDAATGNFVKDRYDFGKNSHVYHTVYFVRPEVVNALTRWLNLQPPEGLPADTAIEQEALSPNRIRKPVFPAIVDVDIVRTTADRNVAEVTGLIRMRAPSFVVVERDDHGRKRNYAYAAAELLAGTRSAKFDESLYTALSGHQELAMHEVTESPMVGSDLATIWVRPLGPAPMARRSIVFDCGTPIGVIPSASDLPTTGNLAQIAQDIMTAGVNAEPGIERRTMPTFNSPPPPAAPPAQNQSTCFFYADMPNQVAIGTTTTVLVSISREVLERVAGPTSQGGSGQVAEDRRMIVQVVPKVNLEVVGDDRAEFLPPPPQKPINLAFDLNGTSAGEGEVWIVIRQGTMALANLVLKPTVVGAAQGAVALRIAAEHHAAEAPSGTELFPLLQIFEARNGNAVFYRYSLDLRCCGGGIRTFRSPDLQGARNGFIAGIYGKIEERYLRNVSDTQAFSRELRAYGVDLADELLPADLQKELWDRRRTLRSIQVLSEEPFIPWELVHLHEPGQQGVPQETLFLGQLGVVRWLHNFDWPSATIRVRANRSKYLIPTYAACPLPEAQREIDFLVARFQASAINCDANALYDALGEGDPPDLFHFAGHGVAEQTGIINARIVLAVRVVNNKYVFDGVDPIAIGRLCCLQGTDGNRALVVVNACQAGRQGWKLSSVGGFAEAFIQAKAGAFVGALWAVGDAPARTFTEALYDALLAGKTLVEATRAARESAQRAGDATWLAYVVYGNPMAKLVRNVT